MSGCLNKVILIGNLGKDPEVKMTQSGQPFARFSLATTETWRAPSGEKQQKTEWHNSVVWGRQVETAEKYLRKGNKVMIEGRIQYYEYKDANGIEKRYTSIKCDNLVMLGRMDDASRQSYGGYDRHQPHAANDFDDSPSAPPPPSQGGYPDDDIPF
jgi:single-strand DNA-binding protein